MNLLLTKLVIYSIIVLQGYEQLIKLKEGLMMDLIEILEIKAETIRNKMDQTEGHELTKLDEELANIEDGILYQKQLLQNEACYQDHLDYISKPE